MSRFAFVFCVFAVLSAESLILAQDSWIRYENVGHPSHNHWYRLTTPGTWEEAEAEAVAAGGHLVTVDDDAENQWLWESFFPGPGDWIWIGYYQDRNDPTYSEPSGGWKWIGPDPQPNPSYTAWFGQEPNDQAAVGENYAVLELVFPPVQWNDIGPQSNEYPVEGIQGIIELDGDPLCDDFEDGVIDAGRWTWGGLNRSYAGAPSGSWQWSHEEVGEVADGHLRMRVWGPTSGGTYGAEAWVRTLYDFNDGMNHVVDFTWEAAVQDDHDNIYYIQVTDGYISPHGDTNWTYEPAPGTTNLLWRDANGQEYAGARLPAGVPKSARSMTIDPAGVARLYDGPCATGTLLREEPLYPSYPWYIRFMVTDATSSGFPAGDISLNLYDFCACEPQCGDGLVQYDEDCDDGNIGDDDGCASACIVEFGWFCTGEPSICVPDCNGNEVDDALDLSGGMSGDCNSNDVPDECDAGETSLDCNTDIIPDECQLVDNDCDGNSVPDDCQPDSDLDTVIDPCDICPGGDDLLDSDEDEVPNFCDICEGGDDALDFDGDGVPNFCDLCPGADDRIDDNNNGFPDACDPLPPIAVPELIDWKKNRYLSFNPDNPDNPHRPDLATAIRVTMVGSLFHPGAVGTSMWVDIPDADGIAGLSNTPVYRDWPEEVIYVTGCLISPVADYNVQATIQEIGDGNWFTGPLAISTIDQPAPKFWGDTVGGFNGSNWVPPQGVTNIDDAVAAIKTFQEAENAPHKSVTDVEPQEPNHIVNINDVFAIIRAFQGEPYPYGCPDDPCHDKTVSPCP